MSLFRCSAILFDLDGVLLDSTRVVAQQYTIWARERGLDPALVLKAAHGVRTVEVVRRVAPHLDAEAETRKIEEREAAATDIVAMPGAVELVHSIPPGRWCVVTSGTRYLATTRMRRFGVPIPDILVTADDVKHGKPDPEPYRKGAEQLKVNPAECVAVEDAPAGIRSAHGAGMRVISLPSTYPVDDLKEADAIVAGLAMIKVSLDGAASGGLLRVSLS
ncbi:MAG TPA: HAD-IA family hydrolase [Terriglobales bacterium]|nr:HAD-IA family hydrolase [Terriglobales bacterium]